MTAASLFYSAEWVSQHNFLWSRNLKKWILDFSFKSRSQESAYFKWKAIPCGIEFSQEHVSLKFCLAYCKEWRKIDLCYFAQCNPNPNWYGQVQL